MMKYFNLKYINLAGVFLSGYLLGFSLHSRNLPQDPGVPYAADRKPIPAGSRADRKSITNGEESRQTKAGIRKDRADRLQSHTGSIDIDTDAILEKWPSKLLGSNQEVSNDICDLLSITDEERAALNSAIKSSINNLQKHQLNNIIQIAKNDNETQFVIPPFEKEGKDEKRKLYSSFQNTLGVERSASLMKIAADSFGERFFGFGESECRINMRSIGGIDGVKWETRILVNGTSRLYETTEIPELLKGMIE